MRRTFVLLVVLLLCAVAVHAQDDPESILEHRRAEAARKNALTAKLRLVDAAKTLNQDRYDVVHYDLDLTLQPSSSLLSGTVTTTAVVVGAAISTFDLDLRSNMTVLEVTSDGLATSLSRSGDLLTVTLDRTYDPGETVTVGVTYAGNPSGEYFGWSSYGGSDMIWTLSEPFGARHWWPCKDVNTDKADSLDVRVTVPDNLIVASQGLLLSDVDNGSTRTFHWHSNYPIVPYLVSLAIHPYVRYSDWYTPLAGGDPMEIQYFIYPSHVGVVEANYSLTPLMIGAFANGYGEYPFVDEKYGHAEFVWGGGMEHQTITSLGGWSEDLISHELAHQWWGDAVTCADFGHIWINEGFATWSEAYWKEQSDGFATYQNYMDIASYFGGGTIFVENVLSDNIFDSNLSYNKGSWVVHMLRGVVGDADFFAGLAALRAQYDYSSCTTEQLRDVFEAVSGRDLDAFFQQWIYGQYFPIYELGWTPGPAAGQITVSIDQVQTNAGLFTMPIQLRVTSDVETVDLTVENDQLSQQFVLDVNGAVSSVELDPDRWILRQVQTAVADPTFDHGLLVVNGVDWTVYDAEIRAAYEDSCFWGGLEFDFWDNYAEPVGGYPSTLPGAVGHGAVPAETIGLYSTVVWIGNNYGGDLADWSETPILSYLESGGNVLLLTRMGSSFIDGDLATYAGVNWLETGAELGNCVAVAPGLTNMGFLGLQTWNDVFSSTGLPADVTLLFTDTAGFSGTRGTGAVKIPAAGGTHRATGGRFAFVMGRPYRLDRTALRNNVTTILTDFLGEPYQPPTAVGDGDAPAPRFAALTAAPNPFNPRTTVRYRLPQAGEARLELYDMRGRRVVVLAQGAHGAGEHLAVWDGRDAAGHSVPSGTYLARLVADGTLLTTKLVLAR